MTITEHVVVSYVDDAGWKEYDFPAELKMGMIGTKDDAEKLAEAILREWLRDTGEAAGLADDEDDADGWYVIGVYGNETEGVWMAICAPDRGERVQFMFWM